ncbi:PREDICTED: acylamino-acid-releasing enzyme-like [Priapulus caudatus]|uniref:Acylamino-acid-releasing enzyme-like n=1 Tax=Priapulus caudatus TaxID=37621 RepID=A0ABM1EWL3_PRICU|nr:PREDICTED: acylamino-acid-releasing enzyme-like [Priapulus caudatus]
MWGFFAAIIGKDDQSVRTPRFSPDLQKLVYLENVARGPDTRAMKLMMFNWVTKKYSTIIDIVMKPTAESGFPGIYPVYVGLPKLCWASDSERVVFHSSWGSRKELVYVSVKSKVIKKISQKEYGSSELLAIQNDWMVVSCSSPNRPPILVGSSLDLTDLRSW